MLLLLLLLQLYRKVDAAGGDIRDAGTRTVTLGGQGTTTHDPGKESSIQPLLINRCYSSKACPPFCPRAEGEGLAAFWITRPAAKKDLRVHEGDPLRPENWRTETLDGHLGSNQLTFPQQCLLPELRTLYKATTICGGGLGTSVGTTERVRSFEEILLARRCRRCEQLKHDVDHQGRTQGGLECSR